MESLPLEFLKEIARNHELSEEQETVFIKLFGSNCNHQEIADSLYISETALRTRMTGVYKKFNFNQKIPNKKRQLHDFLLKKYKKSIDENHERSYSNARGDINALVNQLRDRVKPDIENRCGTMRILDMTQPIALSNIYTQVNILEKVIGRRRKNIAELVKKCKSEDFERLGFGRVAEEKIPAKEAVTKYRKLLILGKPGAGKTTFLKHLAIQCIQGDFQGDLVPFFVTLKDFAEARGKQGGLLGYLNSFQSPLQRENFELEEIFKNGKALILLDGLDEVLDKDSDRVLNEIRYFSTHFSDNQYVMTCRIAAKEYTFEQFTEVEIADFDWKQITTFANNWFKNKAIKPEIFLDRLKEDEPIQELASNPLLLTLLCLAFEESGDFPANRAGLYKEGLDALLKKWDAKRGIKRDEVYQKLWVQRKEDLLSKIAWDTFAPGEYFFKQDKAERYICEYISNLSGANTDEEALRFDSEVVLKSIESQHGLLVARAKNIYSFSHLSFQEYFTAREIVLVRQSSEAGLQELVSHLFEKRWHEVFLLAVAMSPNAERLVLLMKNKIDYLLENLYAQNSDVLNLFFHSLNKKANSLEELYTGTTKAHLLSSIIYWFYFASELNLPFNLARLINKDLAYKLIDSNERELDRLIVMYLKHVDKLSNENIKYFHTYNRTLCSFDFGCLSKDVDEAFRKILFYITKKNNSIVFKNEILKLLEEVPCKKKLGYNENYLSEGLEGYVLKIDPSWWINKGQVWTKKIREVFMKYRHIGNDWQFSDEQKELLKKYYFANQLLTQCLHQECYVSREVRQEIEETLLLPISEIEKRKLSQS